MKLTSYRTHRCMDKWIIKGLRRSCFIASTRVIHLQITTGTNRYTLRQWDVLNIPPKALPLDHTGGADPTNFLHSVTLTNTQSPKIITEKVFTHPSLRQDVQVLHKLSVSRSQVAVLLTQRFHLLGQLMETGTAQVVLVAQLLALQDQPTL